MGCGSSGRIEARWVDGRGTVLGSSAFVPPLSRPQHPGLTDYKRDQDMAFNEPVIYPRPSHVTFISPSIVRAWSDNSPPHSDPANR